MHEKPFSSQKVNKFKVKKLVITCVSKLETTVIKSCQKGVRRFCMLLGCVVILTVFTKLPNELFETYAAQSHRLLITEKDRLV